MAIRVRQFSIGKDADLTRIDRFFQEAGLKTANILSIDVVDQGRDHAQMLVTYEDTTRPFLFTTLPQDGDTNVAIGTPLIAIFSEAIQNVTTTDIEIFDVTDSALISPSLFSIDNSGASNDRGEIRIVDQGYMVANHVYRITFKQSIKDLAGNALAEQETILIGTAVNLANLTFDGGLISSFTLNTALGNNRYESIITPARAPFSVDSIVELSVRTPEDTLLNPFDLYHETLITPTASFQVVLASTGILPTGELDVTWSLINGLL